MNNLDVFIKVYERQLTNAVRDYPQEYMWPVENVPVVAQKMRVAFSKGSYNKDGRAIKATCKELGIKYTYPAINSYLRG